MVRLILHSLLANSVIIVPMAENGREVLDFLNRGINLAARHEMRFFF